MPCGIGAAAQRVYTRRLGAAVLEQTSCIVLGSRLMAQHQPPRIHRGTVYGAKHQKGMTLPAIASPVRNPTPEQRTARVERERTPQQNSTSRADALAQLVARLTDAARFRIVRNEWKGDASPHFDMLAPRLQVCILGTGSRTL